MHIHPSPTSPNSSPKPYNPMPILRIILKGRLKVFPIPTIHYWQYGSVSLFLPKQHSHPQSHRNPRISQYWTQGRVKVFPGPTDDRWQCGRVYPYLLPNCKQNSSQKQQPPPQEYLRITLKEIIILFPVFLCPPIVKMEEFIHISLQKTPKFVFIFQKLACFMRLLSKKSTHTMFISMENLRCRVIQRPPNC